MRIADHRNAICTLVLMAGLSSTTAVQADSDGPRPLQGAAELAQLKAAETAACLQLPQQPLDFNSIDIDQLSAWSGLEKWQYMTNSNLLAVGQDESGRSYLRQKLEPTSKGSAHVVGRRNLPAADTYTLTQTIYLEPGFDWGGKNEGGKIGFGLGGATTPTGGNVSQDGFSARLMWRGNKDGTARMAIYAYSADRSQNLPYGDDYPLQEFAIPVGEWFTITMEVSSNSSNGTSDGRIRAWVDDVLKLQRENIHWQATGEDPIVDKLMYATFHGGNDASWAPDNTVFARFGDVCWQASAYTPPQYDEQGLPIPGDTVNTWPIPQPVVQ